MDVEEEVAARLLAGAEAGKAADFGHEVVVVALPQLRLAVQDVADVVA